MSLPPPISILITTYNRLDLLERTLKSLYENIIYSGNLQFVIANDGENAPVYELVSRLDFDPSTTIKIVGGNRLGLGGNTNRGLRACETDIILQTQDDYLALKPLLLQEHVNKLLEDESAGWIRLKLTGGQDFTATVKHQYWQVSWHSQSIYIASDQPHLKHRRFHAHYGFYAEGLRVVDTENEWCGRAKQIGQERPGPQVLIPVEFPTETGWLHIGDELSFRNEPL